LFTINTSEDTCETPYTSLRSPFFDSVDGDGDYDDVITLRKGTDRGSPSTKYLGKCLDL